MFCPACGFNIRKDYQFCPSCGEKLPKVNIEADNTISGESDKLKNNDKYVICEVCGEENQSSSSLCVSCGAKLDKHNIVEKPVQKNIIQKKTEKVIKEKENTKKGGKSIQEVAGQKKLSPTNLVILIAGLLLLGYVILDLAGIFDQPQHTHINTPGTNINPGINLADVESINQLENQVLSDTTQTQLILQLAHKLGDSGFNERAVKYYEMYLRKIPDNADVQVDLGVVFFELKQYEKAKNRMMKGLELNPSHQIAHFNLGVVNSAQAKMDSAKLWWRKAADINPASDIGRRAQELLNTQ